MNKKAAALSRWFATPAGSRFAQAERALIETCLPKLFGSVCCVSSLYPLEGLSQSVPCLKVCQILTEPDNDPETKGKVIAACSKMPFREESVDAFVLLHTLDFVENPHETIREIARVLRPGGQVIVLGFNPASLLGLGRFFPGVNLQDIMKARFLSRGRLCDWLELLQFEVESTGGLQLLPFTLPAVLQHKIDLRASLFGALMGSMGQAFRERHGSVYLFRFRKMQYSGTLVGYEWFPRTKKWNPLAPGVAVTPRTTAKRSSQPPKKPEA